MADNGKSKLPDRVLGKLTLPPDTTAKRELPRKPLGWINSTEGRAWSLRRAEAFAHGTTTGPGKSDSYPSKETSKKKD